MTGVASQVKVVLDFQHDRTVNYAMQQNHVPVVKRLRLTNAGTLDLAQLAITIVSEPAFAAKWQTTLASLPVGQTADLGVIDLTLSPTFLAGHIERVAGNLTVAIRQGDDEIFVAHSPIDVLAYNEWNGTRSIPEIIAAFVTPNHPEVSHVLRDAANVLSGSTGNASLTGYQTKDALRVRQQLAAIYTALQAWDIAYCVPPASFEAEGQKIRTPDVIYDSRLGTCLDLATLFAACAEAAGLHPLIVFTEGHAFPGVWLVEESFAESVQDDVTLLTKRIASGVHEVCVVEATAFAAGSGCSFDQAVALAESRLGKPDQFHFFVDIRRARSSHIRPIPLRLMDAPPNDGAISADAGTPPLAVAADSHAPTIVSLERGSSAERTRLEQWERRLLDLSLRNPMLNFRVTASSIPLLTPELHDLEDALADGRDFQIHPRPLDWEATPRDVKVFVERSHSDPQVQLMRDEFHQGRLRADLGEKDLANRLTQLYRAARTALQENGANTLYLALGMLVWYESDASEKPRYAPILLMPVEIVRRSVQTGYVVRQREDEPQVNVTLIEMLRQDHGTDVSGLNPLPADDHGVDVQAILATFRRAAMHRPRWDVVENACLGLFSFSKFIMWHDLTVRAEELKRNKVVASLMAGRLQWVPNDTSSDADQLDTSYHPKDILCPISADSSQLQAICTAGAGQSIVLHGPPGTGKSQTITNVIAHALSQGKSVLFVAEKMAALSVVQRRLKQVGLAPYCMELHSNKSKKRDVLDQLRLTLECGQARSPGNWEQEANRLAQLRDELNSYVRALHLKRRIGHSVFDGLGKLAALQRAPNVVVFDAEYVAELDAATYQRLIVLARELRVAGEGCGHPSSNVWALARCHEYGPQLRAQAAEALASLRRALARWRDTVAAVAQLFGVPDADSSHDRLSMLLELAKRFQSVPLIPVTMLREREWEDVCGTVEHWIAHGLLRDKLRLEVYERYADRVMQLDLPALQDTLRRSGGQWFLPRYFARRRVAKTLRAAMKVRTGVKDDQLEAELTRLQHLRDEEAVLANGANRAQDLLGRLWVDGNPDWDAVGNALCWAGEVRKLASAFAEADFARTQGLREQWSQLVAESRDQLEPDGVLGRRLRTFTEAGDATQAEWRRLSILLDIEQSALISGAESSDWFATMAAQIGRWEEGLDGLRDWCAWVRVRTRALDAGLSPLVDAYEQGRLSHADVEPAFARGLHQAWAEHEIGQDQVLSSFSRVLFEDKIQRFREIDETFLHLTRQEIHATLAARVPVAQTDVAQTSEMGVLRRELQKQRNHLALRILFQKMPNVLTRLKPCLLMSPISVAQYLDPSHPPFDLVIFDEASQVPTCDAVGAIARGKEALIVGDHKQLPPTTFFVRASAEEDDDESLAMQDLDSILDDSLAMQMPAKHLRWHYRSRHESLIAFSNYQYYDNGLLTFPSPDDLLPRVRYLGIDGVYDRGKSKQNRAEAEAVVAEIVRRLRDPELSRQSIGVVTFSHVQQQLIEDLLDEQLLLAPDFERFFSDDAEEPVFVKNLENVQGDERDVIIFSVGYGPDTHGRVSMNFGPLNREGGWRRLNVAVSRARQEMLVVTSLRADDLDISRTSARGVADLKAFLEYAERGKRVLYARSQNTPGAEAESVFEEQVGRAIRERGYDVHIQVGCSGYRIDLAVVDPDRPGRYVLGIECDGAMYHRAATARDRDKLRESVLRELGWRIHRIWSTDWWENSRREVERVEEAIAKARRERDSVVSPATTAQAGQKPTRVANVAQKIAQAAPPSARSPVSAAKPYAICRLSPVTRPSEDFYLAKSDRTLAGQIKKVVDDEGPISHALLCRRIADAWRISKVGSRVDARIRGVCAELSLATTECGGSTFYWPPNVRSTSYRQFRLVGTDKEPRRDAEDIPPEEIASAAHELLRRQVALPEGDLVRELARVFGFQRTGGSIEQRLRQGIGLTVQRGDARRDREGRIVCV